MVQICFVMVEPVVSAQPSRGWLVFLTGLLIRLCPWPMIPVCTYCELVSLTGLLIRLCPLACGLGLHVLRAPLFLFRDCVALLHARPHLCPW